MAWAGAGWYYPSWYGYGWGGYYRPYGYGCGMGWWGPYRYYPSAVDHNHYYYGHRTSLGGGSTKVETSGCGTPFGHGPAPDALLPAFDRQVYPVSSGVMAEMPTSRSTASGSTGMDHFTDRSGNVYRRDGSGTERYENGRWQKLPEQSPVAQPNEKPNTRHTFNATGKTCSGNETSEVDPRRIQRIDSEGSSA
ncbi:MAG: hypothetical protein IPH60_15245 [Flavobacteriales bacterium]|nr:hypothetical protein [Flavobacteriales bacterium]